MSALLGFPLTRRQRDHNGHLRLSYWLRTASGAQEVVIDGEHAVAFLAQEE